MQWSNHFKLRQAASIMGAGGVVAYPTEAVWGLGCDPWNPHAVQRVLDIKRRPAEKGLILVAADIGQIHFLIDDLTDIQKAKLKRYWPGPYSILIPHQNRVPQWISGHFDSVAVRVSAHPIVSALCQVYGGPIVSTSANRAGMAAAKSRLQLMLSVGAEVDFVTPGEVGNAAKPSTIIDIRTDTVVRAGG